LIADRAIHTLLRQHRSRLYRAQVEGLRQRLRNHRAESEAASAGAPADGERSADGALGSSVCLRCPLLPSLTSGWRLVLRRRMDPWRPVAEAAAAAAAGVAVGGDMVGEGSVEEGSVEQDAVEEPTVEEPEAVRVIDLRDPNENLTAVDSVPAAREADGQKQREPAKRAW
jgi:hypothetical protein